MSASPDTVATRTEAMLQNFVTQVPADAGQAFASEQAGLDADGLPDGIAQPDSVMPDGELLDEHGDATSLAKARGGKPAVVVFYRGAWCPFCNVALRTYQDQLQPELARRGVELIAISPQKPDGSLSMQQSNGLTYTVLSDPGNEIATALGLLTAPSAETIEAQLTLGLKLTELNADGTHALPRCPPSRLSTPPGSSAGSRFTPTTLSVPRPRTSSPPTTRRSDHAHRRPGPPR